MLVTAASPNSASASTFIGYGMFRRLIVSSKIPNSVTTGAMVRLIYDSGSLTVSLEFPA